jgi:predicted metal-dependent hydrolase
MRKPVGSADRFPPAFEEGVQHFNAGAFFEAHESFEECLDAVESDERWELVLGLIQIAVGYHKLVAGHPGAERMLALGVEKLAAFPDDAFGLAIGRLRRRAAADRNRDRDAVLAIPPRLERA